MLLNCKTIFSRFLPVFAVVLILTSEVSAQNNGFSVRTTGHLPFLEYGTGEDRLGGAKMTFLDTNIILKVVDSFKTKYKVNLSKNLSGYIDKQLVLRSEDSKISNHLTSSWKVYGDSAYDYVTINLDERLPYRSIQQINPSRVVVDIFGVASNTNWITQLSTVEEITNSWYEQVEDDVMRVFIELKHPQHWGHSIFYDGNRLVIRIRRQPQRLLLSDLVIAVDAGHGGENNGADGGVSKELEKNYTLLIAQELQKALIQKKATVVMTREKDTTLSMIERVEFLRQLQPNLLISIHLNSASNDTVRGVSTYYRYIGFRPLSQVILNHMLELGLQEYGNVGNFNFGLSGPTDYPNCLVEVAFLSNREDELKILDPKFHKLVAKKIVEGIEEFLKNL